MLGVLCCACEVLNRLLWCSASALPCFLFLLGMSFQQCKMKHTNIFEVHEMPEAEVSEEEEVEIPPEEAVAVAEPGEPEAPPAEGIWWCPKVLAVLSVLTQYRLLFAPLPSVGRGVSSI